MQAVHQILFDFDYTLVDSSVGVIACVNHALKKTGAPEANPAAIRKMIGHSLEDMFEKFLPCPEPQTVAACKKLFMDYADSGVMVDHTVLLDGADQALEELYQNLYALGIVSTKRRSTIEETLIRFELDDLFDIVIGYEDVRQLKPDPEGLLYAIQQMEGSREDTLYAGDSMIDLNTARNADVPFVAVCTGMTGRNEFYKQGAKTVIGNLNELIILLNQR